LKDTTNTTSLYIMLQEIIQRSSQPHMKLQIPLFT
jgi:hypothetical protein